MTDWAAQESKKLTSAGTKAQQQPAVLDQGPYRAWRRGLGQGLYVNDIDQVEWRMVDGVITPVAVLELTRYVGCPPPSYFQNILERMRTRDPQANVACEIASRLGTDAYVVAWRSDCYCFWVHNLSKPNDSPTWVTHTPWTYVDWLKSLR